MSPPLRPLGVIARYVLLGAGSGAVLGLFWVWLAPRVQVRSVADGDFVQAYPEGFAAADVTLAVLLFALGVVLGGIGAARLRMTGFTKGWAQVAGVIVAGVTAGVTARLVGWWLAGTTAIKTPDGTFELPLTLRSPGVLLLGAFSGLLIVVFAALLSRDPDGA